MHAVARTLVFNLATALLFSALYAFIGPRHFQPLHPRDEMGYLDYFFYATTIQSGVGLPDITAVSAQSKILSILQQWALIGSVFVLMHASR
jgi:hypothetical protein